MKKAHKELIDFFQMQNTEEKNMLLEKYIAEAEKQIGFETILPDDKIGFVWEKNKELPGTLQDFTSVLYDQIIKGVCNVIETA